MRRNWHTLDEASRQVGYQPGDEAAHAVAMGLAQKLDAPTLLALDKMVTLLETVGGQVYAMAIRAEGPDDFETIGLDFHYQTRDARLKVEGQPEQALGIPISDMEGPPALVEVTSDGSADYAEPEEQAAGPALEEPEQELEETASAG